jgi:electron transfer flavoprotein-quinone oxidoreductase
MEKVDVIVVGGGLAGLSAAYGLAQAGLEVMVLERGDYPGAKNVTGGRLYTSVVRDLYPELWEEAPFERAVTREAISMLADGRMATFEIAAEEFGGRRPQSFTVVRAKLDQYLAERTGEAGGMVIPKMKVDALLTEGGSEVPGADGGSGASGRVIGIRAGEDEIGADVVVVAEGVLGLLSSEAGLRKRPAAADTALGYKEVIELPASVIEDRWHLNPGEGAAQLFMGSVTKGMMGGAFLYTNRDSVSLGIVVGMEQMRSRPDELESWQLLDELKANPAVAPLIKGGEVIEYSAHAVAEGGIAKLPRLLGDGYVMVGDAAGLSLNALITVRGMDFAIASGYHAAQAIAAAKAAGDTSAAGLAGYERALRESFVLKDLQTAADVPALLENQRLFTHYPEAVTKLMADIFTIGPGPTEKLFKTGFGGVRRSFLNLATAKDALSFRKI